MKRHTLFILALLCIPIFTSCNVTSHVTTYGLFENTVKEVTEELEQAGFRLVDTKKDIYRNPNHPPVYVNKFNGTDLPYTNSYSFENEKGETMSYSVVYHTGGDPSSLVAFVREVFIESCQTSNKNDYERLCGDTSPIHKLDTLSKNATVRL